MQYKSCVYICKSNIISDIKFICINKLLQQLESKKQPIRIINITGNIGSGKSTVSQIFKANGYPVFNSDFAAKSILTKNAYVVKKTNELLGDKNGGSDLINTQKLAKVIFSQPVIRKKINELIHPLVENKFEKWCLLQNSIYVIRETALYFEAALNQTEGISITVLCPDYIRFERIKKRNGLSLHQFYKRELSQFSQWEKAENSDFIIMNSNDKLLIPQVEKIVSALR